MIVGVAVPLRLLPPMLGLLLRPHASTLPPLFFVQSSLWLPLLERLSLAHRPLRAFYWQSPLVETPSAMRVWPRSIRRMPSRRRPRSRWIGLSSSWRTLRQPRSWPVDPPVFHAPHPRLERGSVSKAIPTVRTKRPHKHLPTRAWG